MRTFEQIFQEITTNSSHWIEYYESTDRNLIEPPPPFDTSLTHFQKLLLFKCFRPTKILHCVRIFIANAIGMEFTEPPAFNLASAFSDSTCKHPLLFILSPDSDPLRSIEQLARSQSVRADRISSLSLGQQPHAVAMKMIEEGTKSGDWVILQNCHLARDWMPALERVCDSLAPDSAHQDFRLWLTSNPVEFLPLPVLHNCVKLVDEPPKRLRDSILRSFTGSFIDSESWARANQRELIYPLCKLHAITRLRARFGPVGWTDSCAFNESDSNICIDELIAGTKTETIRFMLGECIYGGRVSNLQDKLRLNALINGALSENENGVASASTFEAVLSFVKKLPAEDAAADFGLHSNAAIVRLERETSGFIESVRLNCLTPTNEVIPDKIAPYISKSISPPQKTLFNEFNDDTITARASHILSVLPAPFDLTHEEEKIKTQTEDWLNVVFIHEITRYNGLLHRISSSCRRVMDAVSGECSLSFNQRFFHEGCHTLARDAFDH